MKVYVSVDIEGVAGVVHAEQGRRGRGGYADAARWMTLEANAAALGAFDAGATAVLINDSHGDMRNLLLDELDPRVQVISGNLKPFSMAQGLDDGRFDVAMFVGYHGGAGTTAAILDHTYRGAVVSQIRLGGRAMNEAALNALVAGHAGTPVGLITGDESTCRQCVELLAVAESTGKTPPDTVVTKWAFGRLAARSLHPVEARARIREAAAKVVRSHERFAPFRLDPPYALEVDMVTTAMVDAAALMPGTERTGPRTIAYRTDDVQVMFRAMLALVRLGGVGLV
jgi:D-amino peptidase